MMLLNWYYLTIVALCFCFIKRLKALVVSKRVGLWLVENSFLVSIFYTIDDFHFNLKLYIGHQSYFDKLFALEE